MAGEGEAEDRENGEGRGQRRGAKRPYTTKKNKKKKRKDRQKPRDIIWDETQGGARDAESGRSVGNFVDAN